jgi:mRNA-degrading endonuclease RelE of RelBE toxin-antitoxin system
LALEPCLSSDAQKYIAALDRITRNRIRDKILELANDPTNIRTSKPLKGSDKRTARVGAYRILFMIVGESATQYLLVSDVGPRNQIYRKA